MYRDNVKMSRINTGTPSANQYLVSTSNSSGLSSTFTYDSLSQQMDVTDISLKDTVANGARAHRIFVFTFAADDGTLFYPRKHMEFRRVDTDDFGTDELPELQDAGDVLTINSGETGVEWAAPVSTTFYGLRAGNWQYCTQTERAHSPNPITIEHTHVRLMIVPLNPNPSTQYSFILQRTGTPTGDIRLAMYLINSAGNWALDNSVEHAARGLSSGFRPISDGVTLSSSHAGSVLGGWALLTIQPSNSNEVRLLRIPEHDSFPGGTSGMSLERNYGSAALATISNTTASSWRYPVMWRY